jgi:hypothetical protein
LLRCARCLLSGYPMLDAEAVQAAVLASAGDLQSLMNHLGLAARSAPAAKFGFESDLRAFLRRALQFGQPELVSVEAPLGAAGILSQPSDVVVSARSKVPQLAIELQWHPRGEDHVGFANVVMADVLKMAVARTRNVVEQGTVLVAAPTRFWRWLPGYAEDRVGYELLNPEGDAPVSAKSDFLAGATWDFLFAAGLETELPDRIWASLLANTEVRSPWADLELHLLDVKGLGSVQSVRSR